MVSGDVFLDARKPSFVKGQIVFFCLNWFLLHRLFPHMFATVRQTKELFQSLVSGPNDLPPGDGPYGSPVGQGDLWGDYTAVGFDVRGNLCAPEKEGTMLANLKVSLSNAH